MKLIFCVKTEETFIHQGFSDTEKERKLQYLWYHNFRSYMVELTGLAPVYQRKPTKLSPYTVCFGCHTTKKANELAVSRHLRVSVTIGAPAEGYLFAKSDADHLASQRSQGPRAGFKLRSVCHSVGRANAIVSS